MNIKYSIISLIVLLVLSCNSNKEEDSSLTSYSDVLIGGAMKNVMKQGKLEGNIKLDTIQNKKGLYGLGPVSYLKGELLINNGESYVSRVYADSAIHIEKTFDVSAPFFVYANVHEWNEIKLPETIKTMKGLEIYLDKNTKNKKRPFCFKLNGKIKEAEIHIQNLPDGEKIASPEEAHKSQVTYQLQNEYAEIIGFFSTEHQGIFTHHDSFLHMHLITKDETKMGHLDSIEFGQMTLYLPEK